MLQNISLIHVLKPPTCEEEDAAAPSACPLGGSGVSLVLVEGQVCPPHLLPGQRLYPPPLWDWVEACLPLSQVWRTCSEVHWGQEDWEPSSKVACLCEEAVPGLALEACFEEGKGTNTVFHTTELKSEYKNTSDKTFNH